MDQPEAASPGVNRGFRVPLDLLEEFDAICRSPEVDSDRSKVIRSLIREFVAEHKAKHNGDAA